MIFFRHLKEFFKDFFLGHQHPGLRYTYYCYYSITIVHEKDKLEIVYKENVPRVVTVVIVYVVYTLHYYLKSIIIRFYGIPGKRYLHIVNDLARTKMSIL